jgi:SAM-dependent methyltransferase
MGERERWEELYATGARPDRPPSRWILDAVAALPNDVPVADVAGGSGRHAIPLVRAGRAVVLLDFSHTAVHAAVAAEPRVQGIVADAGALPLRPGRFGIVLVAHFLDRDAMPAIRGLVAPGGYLVYETYTVEHLRLVERGLARGPSSPRFLLSPGELPALCAPLVVLSSEEGEARDEAGHRITARVVARRPG